MNATMMAIIAVIPVIIEPNAFPVLRRFFNTAASSPLTLAEGMHARIIRPGRPAANIHSQGLKPFFLANKTIMAATMIKEMIFTFDSHPG